MTNDIREEYKTAIHEAGHGVAHVRLGLVHDGVSIIPKGDRLGNAPGEGVGHVYTKSGAEPVVLALCAGYAALLAAGYSDADARVGADQDFAEAEYLIEFWGLSGGIEVWQDQAVALMRKPENVAAAALIAHHVMLRKRLDGDYVGVLVELSDGDATEADFARYLQRRGIAA